ncbi:Immunoglobulin a1 protease [Fusarium acutatum]|uniref:Immunoglobulin a1 protease n=1 Tax=Fusarium acutatum TaxID=78861 RepID=A0A8H4JY27_9HYPO|nr:Immunoglobulin a1 protease [Fusarium acutatum]
MILDGFLRATFAATLVTTIVASKCHPNYPKSPNLTSVGADGSASSAAVHETFSGSNEVIISTSLLAPPYIGPATSPLGGGLSLGDAPNYGGNMPSIIATTNTASQGLFPTSDGADVTDVPISTEMAHNPSQQRTTGDSLVPSIESHASSLSSTETSLPTIPSDKSSAKSGLRSEGPHSQIQESTVLVSIPEETELSSDATTISKTTTTRVESVPSSNQGPSRQPTETGIDQTIHPIDGASRASSNIGLQTSRDVIVTSTSDRHPAPSTTDGLSTLSPGSSDMPQAPVPGKSIESFTTDILSKSVIESIPGTLAPSQSFPSGLVDSTGLLSASLSTHLPVSISVPLDGKPDATDLASTVQITVTSNTETKGPLSTHTSFHLSVSASERSESRTTSVGGEDTTGSPPSDGTIPSLTTPVLSEPTADTSAGTHHSSPGDGLTGTITTPDSPNVTQSPDPDRPTSPVPSIGESSETSASDTDSPSVPGEDTMILSSPDTSKPGATNVPLSDTAVPFLSDTVTSETQIPNSIHMSTINTEKPSPLPVTTVSPAETSPTTPSATNGNDDNEQKDEDNTDSNDDDHDDNDGPTIVPIPIPIRPPKPGDGKGGDKPNDSNPTKEPPKSTKGTETTSSCATSISMTWESVMCTVTAAVTTGKPACTTQAFTTVVSCSGTTSSATTRTTTVQATQSTWACRPGKCSGGKCGLAKRGTIKRATDPPKCKWSGPENYADPANFIAAEGSLAKSNTDDAKSLYVVSLPEGGSTSSKRILFGNEPISLSVPHLVGCTSIIVVSNRGAWANHIWEEPVFKPMADFDTADGSWYIPQLMPDEIEQLGPPVEQFPAQQQLDFFRYHALDRLHTPYDEVPTRATVEDHEYGLNELRRAGRIFDDESDPHIFFFLPYKIIEEEGDDQYNEENPVGLPSMWDRDGAPSPRADEDGPTFNDQLRSEIAGIFPDIPIETVMYAADLESDPEDIEGTNPRGRAMVQYQPGDTSDCDTKARWRIFFERQLEPMKEVEWTPLLEEGDQDSQWCDPSEDKKLQARAACEISATASLPSLPTLIGSIIDVLNPTKPSLPDFTQLLPSDLPTKTATSQSSAPATTSTIAEADPTQSTTPFADTGRTDCYDADSFSHEDTTSDVFVEVTEKFCKSLEGVELDSDSEDIYELYKDSATGEQYAYTVSWVAGCVTDRKSQELTDPTEMGSPNCREMFGSSYHFCNEDGPHLGGTTQFGCVQYDVKAGWTGEN